MADQNKASNHVACNWQIKAKASYHVTAINQSKQSLQPTNENLLQYEKDF